VEELLLEKNKAAQATVKIESNAKNFTVKTSKTKKGLDGHIKAFSIDQIVSAV
jgi:hypothetical protein